MLPFSALEWLLGSKVYTRAVHSNLDIDFPKEVLDPLSVGLKYLWPIEFSTKKVKSAWDAVKAKAMTQWALRTMKSSYSYDKEMNRMCEIINSRYPPLSEEEAKKIYDQEQISSDEFFRLPVPFVVRETPGPTHVVPWIEEAFDLGWGEIDRVLSSTPMINKDGRPRAVDLKGALRWLESHKILVKPTDKNLGTALVSLEWYDDAICSFIKSNRGYQIVDPAIAQVRLIRQVRQIIAVANTDIAHELPGLRSYLVSRLPGLDRKSTRLNSSHRNTSRMPSSA